MIDRHLGKTITSILEFLHHLKADRTGVTFQFDFVKNFPSDQPEIAIHIPQLETEGDFYNMMINSPDDHPDQGIVP